MKHVYNICPYGYWINAFVGLGRMTTLPFMTMSNSAGEAITGPAPTEI